MEQENQSSPLKKITSLIKRNSFIHLYFIALFILFILMFFIVINLFFKSSPLRETNVLTPTPIITKTILKENYTITPLEKTDINITKEEDVIKKFNILSKKSVDDITIYTIKSPIPGQTDEIRIKNGVVIFERVNTKTITITSLPNIENIEKKYGKPELVVDNVGEGFYTSLYLYASKGFAVLANRFTKSVYEVQRFIPMSIDEYKKNYPEFFIKAPTPKGEKP